MNIEKIIKASRKQKNGSDVKEEPDILGKKRKHKRSKDSGSSKRMKHF